MATTSKMLTVLSTLAQTSRQTHQLSHRKSFSLFDMTNCKSFYIFNRISALYLYFQYAAVRQRNVDLVKR